MNLTPEEKFNQTVWWVLQEIKKESLATPKNRLVYFEPQFSNNLDPSAIDQRRALKLLEKDGAINVQDKKYPLGLTLSATFYNLKPIGYFLNILQPNFDKIYKKFGEMAEKYQLHYTRPEELFPSEVISNQTAEIERQMDEARKWYAEKSHKDRQHWELMKQNRILTITIDKYTHALNTIIEWAEFYNDKNKNGNSFSIDYYYFNFEDRMDDLKMLEKFLTELNKKGCFEKYERVNYANGTRFEFVNPSIKKLKEFKAKREKQETKTIQVIKRKTKEEKRFEIKIEDRRILINDYLLSKPHAVGINLEFFQYVRSRPANTKIERKTLPNFGGLSLKQEVKNKSFIKILNELGFKGEILKAFFPKRGKDALIYNGDKITKKDLQKIGIKIHLLLKELELAHLKNSPE